MSYFPSPSPFSFYRASEKPRIGWCLSIWVEPVTDAFREFGYAYQVFHASNRNSVPVAATGRIQAGSSSEAFLKTALLCLQRLLEASEAVDANIIEDFVFRMSEGLSIPVYDKRLVSCLDRGVMDALCRNNIWPDGSPLPYAELWQRLRVLETELGSPVTFWDAASHSRFSLQSEVVEMCRSVAASRTCLDAFYCWGLPSLTPVPNDFLVGL